ncbi:MAG: hypothetical protein BWY68_00673 [bacterium ADurb.Bin400]|nr:MAG: hypothetical protein BWY68_00673 [bacterium ADurb.Bin400]
MAWVGHMSAASRMEGRSWTEIFSLWATEIPFLSSSKISGAIAIQLPQPAQASRSITMVVFLVLFVMELLGRLTGWGVGVLRSKIAGGRGDKLVRV